MKLVFIHGWGLDPSFWDGIAVRLKGYAQQRVDLGFYGTPIAYENDGPALLVGHSLGFIHGIKKTKGWRAWIAINSFPRFVKTADSAGCTSAGALREMRMRLDTNPQKTLKDFHAYIGTQTPSGTFNVERLREGLDELRDGDIHQELKAPGLVLASRNDPLVPEKASQALAEGHKILWHEKGGHILPQCDAVWCANAIEEYVKSHE